MWDRDSDSGDRSGGSEIHQYTFGTLRMLVNRTESTLYASSEQFKKVSVVTRVVVVFLYDIGKCQ